MGAERTMTSFVASVFVLTGNVGPGDRGGARLSSLAAG